MDAYIQSLHPKALLSNIGLTLDSWSSGNYELHSWCRISNLPAVGLSHQIANCLANPCFREDYTGNCHCTKMPHYLTWASFWVFEICGLHMLCRFLGIHPTTTTWGKIWFEFPLTQVLANPWLARITTTDMIYHMSCIEIYSNHRYCWSWVEWPFFVCIPYFALSFGIRKRQIFGNDLRFCTCQSEGRGVHGTQYVFAERFHVIRWYSIQDVSESKIGEMWILDEADLWFWVLLQVANHWIWAHPVSPLMQNRFSQCITSFLFSF